ncbi:hypothetical protein LMG9964_04160 [Paraburkholderia phenoliruptrix]|uniref:Uncharacterized protein n=1 Tax=Paraburkholderia phenoliruptrix TaxID=252970 RepID=A0A6J5KC98_9BURK|nr:hypothetical protein LMG9964_04160 [Paraburkholderia phenoliruptrix]
MGAAVHAMGSSVELAVGQTVGHRKHRPTTINNASVRRTLAARSERAASLHIRSTADVLGWTRVLSGTDPRFAVWLSVRLHDLLQVQVIMPVIANAILIDEPMSRIRNPAQPRRTRSSCISGISRGQVEHFVVVASAHRTKFDGLAPAMQSPSMSYTERQPLPEQFGSHEARLATAGTLRSAVEVAG